MRVELLRFLKLNGHNLSVSTVLHCRKMLGWTCRGSVYCQLICKRRKQSEKVGMG